MGKAKGKHRLDKYHHLAEEQGYRSRAAYKLLQLDAKFRFLRSSRSVLDLCAAPGGWLQVAVRHVPVGSFVLGVDLFPILPIRGALSIEEDITTQRCCSSIKKLMDENGCRAFDVVLHDGSPNVDGALAQEATSQAALVIDAVKVATEFLAPKGTFVTKVFRSQDYSAILYCLKQLFNKVEVTKPGASRSTSAEIYVVGLRYKAPAKIDPRLLDVKHLFQGAIEPPRVLDVLRGRKQKRHREGYEDGVTTSRKGKKELQAADSTQFIDENDDLNDSEGEETPAASYKEDSPSDIDSDDEQRRNDDQPEELLDQAYEQLVSRKEGSAKQRKRAKNARNKDGGDLLKVLDMRCTGRRTARRPVCTMTGSKSHPQLPQTDVGPVQPQLSQAKMGPSQPQPQDPPQSIGSIEAPSDLSSTKKKTRGPTRCLEVWNMREGQRIPITTNTLGQPVGDNVSKLTNFLGTIARNGEFAPLTFSDWRAVPDESKDDMWGLVTSKFDIDTNIKSWVLMSIGKKWREWKCELKKLHYLPHETDEKRLADLDERVQSDQWKVLIEFWNSEEGKARNKTNTKNRGKQKISHAAGSKSFARIREEERAKRADGEDLTRAEMFILTHTCKDGRPVDEASSVAMSQLNERINQHSEASQSSTTWNDVFSQVMGEDRHGRVRTYGLGPSPSDLRGTTPMLASVAQKRDERYKGLQAEISSLKETVAEMSSLRETLATLMSALTNPNINLATVLGVSANPNQNQPFSSSTSQRSSAKKGKTTTRSSAEDVIEVLLTSVARPGVTVAKGAVLSKDPLIKVGGQELGTDYWEVYVQVAMICQEALIRPYGRYKTIGDVVETSIAWPASLCRVVGRDR
ncbi:uncharacterized protein LOC131235582 [Magnolia sinica]|uniref:uncharacterized protein LOC131235582 n=1 Tax=Magnolia sinica TaxID=86752 RepID=UPI00265B1F77|nr:uncharacterized protein LOC131235582 [Magnolia sinica]